MFQKSRQIPMYTAMLQTSYGDNLFVLHSILLDRKFITAALEAREFKKKKNKEIELITWLYIYTVRNMTWTVTIPTYRARCKLGWLTS